MVMIKIKPLTAQERTRRHRNVKEYVRNSRTQVKYVQAIRARAGHICEECGAPGTEAHHIVELMQLIEQYDLQTPEQADACKALTDMDNGVCLCHECHAKRHPGQVAGDWDKI